MKKQQFHRFCTPKPAFLPTENMVSHYAYDALQLFVSSVSVTAPPEPDEQSRVLAEFPESALITTL